MDCNGWTRLYRGAIEAADARFDVFRSLLTGYRGAGFLYRHFRTKALPAVSNAEFVAEFLADYPIGAAPAEILTERKRISEVLGAPEEKLSPRQSPEFLSRQLSIFGSFGVGWTDLMYDLTKARETCGLDLLDAEPSTIGELIRELISVREGLPEPSRSRARVESIS